MFAALVILLAVVLSGPVRRRRGHPGDDAGRPGHDRCHPDHAACDHGTDDHGCHHDGRPPPPRPPPRPPPTTTTTTTKSPSSATPIGRGAPHPVTGRDTVSDIRFAQRDGFTRVVFDFTGGIPACNVGYADPHTLAVIVHPIDIANPFAAGIFDGSGQLQVGTISVNRVSAGGMGGGSGEWEFSIDVAGTRAFKVFTLESPSRLAIDIED